MIVKTVSYARLYNLGNYENERFECEVEVRPGQTPEQAVAEAKVFVEAQYAESQKARGRQQEVEDLDHRAYYARQKLQTLETRRGQLAHRVNQLIDLLTLHGVKVDFPREILEPIKEEPVPPEIDIDDEDDDEEREE